MTADNRPGITTIYPPEKLAETEAWVKHADILQIYWDILNGSRGEEEKHSFLSRMTNLEIGEGNLTEWYFNQNQKPVEFLRGGSYLLQRNTYGMYTCQIACAINALRFLGLYDARSHTEEAFIEAIAQKSTGGRLGGREYAAQNSHGVITRDIASALPVLPLKPD